MQTVYHLSVLDAKRKVEGKTRRSHADLAPVFHQLRYLLL